MEYIILSLIVVMGSLYVSRPFSKSFAAKVKSPQFPNSRLSDARERRDTVLAALKDLEFDHEMGKISEEDFARMNAQLRGEAVALLQQIDRANGKKTPRQVLESELRALHEQKKSTTLQTCTGCGARVGKQDRFCSNCGAKVQITTA